MFTNFLAKKRIFQKSATLIFITFMGCLIGVTVFAYTRYSGSTNQDMSKAQFIRKQTEAR